MLCETAPTVPASKLEATAADMRLSQATEMEACQRPDAQTVYLHPPVTN
jgi:hypothetical protein